MKTIPEFLPFRSASFKNQREFLKVVLYDVIFEPMTSEKSVGAK